MGEKRIVGRTILKRTWVFSILVILFLNFHPFSNEEVLGNEQPDEPVGMDLVYNGSYQRTIQPGYAAAINLTLNSYDTGSHGEQVYNISTSINTTGWTLILDTPPDMGDENPEYIRTESNSSRSFKVIVYAPMSGPYWETANITIFAQNFDNNSIKDSISVIFTVDHILDFQLQYMKQASTDPLDPHVGKKWDGIDPGAQEMYTISILNKGNVNDSYELTLDEPPAGTVWDWYFFETGSLTANVNLSSSNMIEEYGGTSGASFSIVVRCPVNATARSEIPVILNGESLKSKSPYIENITKTDTLILIVGKVNSLILTFDDPPKYIVPNGTVEIMLSIIHLGNQAVINVILSIEGKTPGWRITYPEDPISIYQHQTKQVPIRISAPGYATMYKEFEMTIIAINQGLPDNRGAAKVNVYLLAPTFYELGSQFHPLGSIIIGPGENASVNLKVINRGNVNETVNVTIEDRDQLPLSVTMDPFDGFIEYLPGWYNSILCNISIKTFMTTPPGDYNVTFIMRSENCNHTAVFKVHVLEVKGVRIGSRYSGEGAEEIVIGPGMGYQKEFYIENTGNGILHVNPAIGIHKVLGSIEGTITPMDWISNVISYSKNEQRLSNSTMMITSSNIKVSDLVDNTRYWYQGRPGLDELKIILYGQEIIWITLMIVVPDNDGLEPVENRNISIGVLNETGVLEDMFHLQFNIQYPDVEFRIFFIYPEEADDDLEFVEDDHFILSVSIENIGSFHSSMTSFTIWIDGITVAVIGVDPLDPSEVYHFPYNFSLSAGDHNITMELDPSNSIYESNDQFMSNSEPGSNIFSIDIRIKERGQDEIETNWLLIFIILLTFFVLLAVLIFMAFRLKKDLTEE